MTTRSFAAMECLKRIPMLKGLILSFFMALAMAQAQAAPQNKITAMSVTQAGAGTTVIKVELAAPLANTPAGFTINTPARIALDFLGTANGLGRSVQNFSVGDLRSANIIQAGSRTRLVINLDHMLPYDTRLEGKNVLITLHARLAGQVASLSRFADNRAGTQKHSLSKIDFHRSKNGAGRIQVDLSDSDVGIDIHRQGTKLIVDFMKTNLPHRLQRKLDVVDFATPVQTIDTYEQGDNTRMVIEPKGSWEHVAYQTDNKFIIEVKPRLESKLAEGEKAGYVGKKISLNFPDTPVRDVLYVFSDITGKNIVLSDTVKGNLSLILKDVPADQALDIILQSRGLAKRVTGNVIQVAPIEELAAAEKKNLMAQQDISALEELHTESFQLGYQKASVVVKMLMGGGAQAGAQAGANLPGGTLSGATAPNVSSQRILSSRGSAMADVRTNTLFIKDTPSRLDDVRKLIKQIDVPAKQVLIEARIVEAHDGFARNLGVRLGFVNKVALGNPNGLKTIGAAVTGIGGAGGVGVGSVFTPSTGNVNLPVTGAGAAAAGVFQFALFNALATKVLNVELTAMQSDNTGKIISSPRVVSENNDANWAIIEQGEKIPYVVSTVANGVVVNTVSFKKAVLKLSVKTKITPDNNVDMMVKVRKDSRGVAVAGNLPINTNSVMTKVLVENGGTVVIGGVYKQSSNKTVNKVPLLGDIPILGNLFKSKGVSTVKDELLIFLSPKILQDSLNLK
ncbi:MAG: type IV pilus secretin PilQ [Gallionella sp.]